MSKTTVAVMMPFGGSIRSSMTAEEKEAVRVQQRRCSLEFFRLKYLVENKCEVASKGREDEEKETYDVKLFQAQVGNISMGALELLRDADVLICLLTERNVNVIYELAVRNALRDMPIMIIKGNPAELKPIYLQEFAHITYSEGSDGKVSQQIENIAGGEFPAHIDKLPDGLKEAIDRYDQTFKENLEDALQSKTQENPPRRPNPMEELFPLEAEPANLLAGWESNYFPVTVVKIPWKGKENPLKHYTLDDLDGGVEGIEVCEYNDSFLDLFSLSRSDVKRLASLNMEHLLDRLESTLGHLSPEDRAEFEMDQGEVMARVVFKEEFINAASKVPLRVGDHRDLNFKNRLLMPCVVARRVIGEKSQDHIMYLVVVYVDVTDVKAETMSTTENATTAETPK